MEKCCIITMKSCMYIPSHLYSDGNNDHAKGGIAYETKEIAQQGA